MREQPGAPDLLDGVAEFLRAEVMPRLSGRLAFHTRVAINVLAIVRRELLLGPAAQAREAARLQDLLGEAGDVDALTARLCDRIAASAVSPDDPALLDHLWATTLDTMAIDQPGYATYRPAAEQIPKTEKS